MSALRLGLRDGVIDLGAPHDYRFSAGEIAASLAGTNRFLSHRGSDFVSEHTIRVARRAEALAVADSRDAETVLCAGLFALHHDDSEAVLGDMPGPYRSHLARVTPVYEQAHSRVQSAIETQLLARAIGPEWLTMRDIVQAYVDRADAEDGLETLNRETPRRYRLGATEGDAHEGRVDRWLACHAEYVIKLTNLREKA